MNKNLSEQILIVEDSKFVASIIRTCLKKWNYDHLILSNGAEAWEYILKNRPKIVLLDWNLPGMDGITICKKIREIKDDEYVYIIMLTSMDEVAHRLEGFKAGADDYITKPFEETLLHSRIKVGKRILELETKIANKVDQLAEANKEQDQLINKLQEQNRIISIKSKELRETQKKLLETARRAGMAEIATSVLHNVGNVLNTAMTSSTILTELVNSSKISVFSRLIELIKEKEDKFGEFISNDPRGQKLPEFIIQINDALVYEYNVLSEKLKTISQSHEHIRAVISLQQSHAGISGVKESVELLSIVKDAAQLLGGSFQRHDIDINYEAAENLESVLLEKHKVLQILMNLFKNARDALKNCDREKRRIDVKISKSGKNKVAISISDNGIGISQENLQHIFNFGFSTKSSGHGFGLHGCANIAKEMGGAISVESEGKGKGASFSLVLPVEKG